MAPEANKPGSTQTGSDKFVEGLHPTDGVRPFKHGDLPDVHEDLAEGIPADISKLDPETLDFVFPKIPIETAPPKKSRKGLLISLGSAAAGVATIAGAMFAFGDGDKADESRGTTPTASAPAELGGEIQPDNEPASIDGIETRPSAEQLRLAETPVTNSDFPTIEEAFPALFERYNVYNTGATMDFSSPPAVETPESTTSGEKLLDVIYGPDHETRAGFDTSSVETVRNIVGLKFYYLYEIEDEEATFRYNSDVTSIEKTSVPGATEAYVVHSIVSVTSNIPELDPTGHEFDELLSSTYTQESTVALSPDGNWYFEGVQTLE